MQYKLRVKWNNDDENKSDKINTTSPQLDNDDQVRFDDAKVDEAVTADDLRAAINPISPLFSSRNQRNSTTNNEDHEH